MNSSLKRRQTAGVSFPSDLEDIEASKSSEDLSSDGSDRDEKTKDGECRRLEEVFLSGLSPVSRKVVKMLAPTHPCLPLDRCTSECLTAMVLQTIPSLAALVLIPLLMWDGYPEEWGFLNAYPLVRHLELVWNSLLHTCCWPIFVGTFLLAALIPRRGAFGCCSGKGSPSSRVGAAACAGGKAKVVLCDAMVNICRSNWKICLLLSIMCTNVILVAMTLQMVTPSLLWNPFMWGWYKVYLPRDIGKSLKGACLDVEKHGGSRRPLCLAEKEWDELSSGRLSSNNLDDVLTVQKGLDYLQNESGGILFSALARNVADAIPALKQNMDGLVPFFKDSQNKLSLVVFENDSIDGTRQDFKAWAQEEAGRQSPRYTVDVMSCGEENPDCHLNVADRYDNMNHFKNKKSSGVGKLGDFRQGLLEYILKKDEYKNFSHMIALDVDLGTSISPLGMLHTLGLESSLAQEHVVASSSRQVWPGSLGTIIPPYDLSAFRPKETKRNQRLRELQKSFCGLAPAGDRWRNMCDAASSMQMFMIMSADDAANNNQEPYEVSSAFNGLAMYPMNIIRERGDQARYDAGDDGQRCEHIGFHLSLQKTMYVNPKWRMNLKPSKPGGPVGLRALLTLYYSGLGRPKTFIYVSVFQTIFLFTFVLACWMIATTIKNLCVLLGFPREKTKNVCVALSLPRQGRSYEQEKTNERGRLNSSDSGCGTREM